MMSSKEMVMRMKGVLLPAILAYSIQYPTRSTRSGFGPGTGRGSQAQAITIAPSLWWDRLRETSFS